MFTRNSKFRHVFGLPSKKELCYESFRVARTAHEPSPCAVNPWFAAMVVESSGGGTFIVIPLKKKGRVAADHPKVRGHSASITDLKWNPFDPWIIASSSEDCTVKLWRLPFDGLHLDLSQCKVDLRAHAKKVTHIEWHPTASDILLSASTDLQCIVWNTSSASAVHSISLHPDVILSISWNRTGSLFASTCRDRRIRVIDPRQGTVVAEGEGHEGSKASKVIFLTNRNWIFTTGFSRGSQRQMALWDAGDLTRPIRVEDVDSSSGMLIPFFDPDTSIVYLAGKGDGNIRFYEIVSHPPYVVSLGNFLSNAPQCGLGMMPKWGVDPYKCELVRFYKLHSTKDLCEPISMIAPRKSERFQEDIFPATSSPEPALRAEDWLQGHDAEPKKISMKDIGETLLAFFTSMYTQRGSDDSPDANNTVKSDNWKQEEQTNGGYNHQHPTQRNAKEDGRRNSDDEENAECFQRGMVRLNIGRFEPETLKLHSRPSATDPTLRPLPPHPPPVEEMVTGLKTNGVTPTPDGLHASTKISESDMDVGDGFTSIRPRQFSSPLSASSSDHRVPQKDIRFYVNLQGAQERKNGANDSTERIHSQRNGTQETVTIGTRNELDQSNNVRFRSQVNEFGQRTQGNSEFRSGSRISRSRSELPVSYRYPFWTSKSLQAEPEVEEEEEEHEAARMLDFISTEAPDDSLIKPSLLRSSMLVRRREKDPDETEGHSLRRTSSLREKRSVSFESRQAGDREMTGIASSRFDDGKPEQNVWGSSTHGDAVDKKILKTEEDRRVWKIVQDEVERKSSPVAFRSSVYEHRFQSTLPSPQEETRHSYSSGFLKGTNSETVLAPTARITHQGAKPEAERASGICADSVCSDDSGETVPQTVPGNVQETGTLNRRESMKFRSASMERWKLHYERLVQGGGRGGRGGIGGRSGGGGGGESDQSDSGSTPKSNENVITTQLVVMLTPQGDKMVSSLSEQKDRTENKSRSSAGIQDVEENRNRNWTMWNGKEPETKGLVQRSGWSDDENTPSDYNELLSEFVQQRQLIQSLRGELQIRDRTIQRLEKQLGLLLRQTISLPALSNYG